MNENGLVDVGFIITSNVIGLTVNSIDDDDGRAYNVVMIRLSVEMEIPVGMDDTSELLGAIAEFVGNAVADVKTYAAADVKRICMGDGSVPIIRP